MKGKMMMSAKEMAAMKKQHASGAKKKAMKKGKKH